MFMFSHIKRNVISNTDDLIMDMRNARTYYHVLSLIASHFCVYRALTKKIIDITRAIWDAEMVVPLSVIGARYVV